MSAASNVYQALESGNSIERLGAGIYGFGVGSIATGVFDLIWADFENAHQPIQAFGDHIPGRTILAYIAAVWLIVGGAAILLRRTRRSGALALAGIYLIFAIFWLPRFYTAPHALGFSISVIVGLIVGVAQQLILVAAAAILFLRDDSRGPYNPMFAIRCTFGLSSIDFGLAHLTAAPLVAKMVPAWLPFDGKFWVIVTGIAFIIAGLAITSAILDTVAARLLAAMLLIFSLLVLAPGVIAHPQNHVTWGSNAYNLTAIAAVWIYAEWLASYRKNIVVSTKTESSDPRLRMQ